MSLQGWGDTIRQQAEDQRAKDAAKLKELEALLPAEKAKLALLSNELLLQHYVHHRTAGFMTVFKPIHEEMTQECEKLILARMVDPNG